MKSYDEMTREELLEAVKSLMSKDKREQGTKNSKSLIEELEGKRAELEDSAKRYQDLYDFAPLSYVSLDENGFIREINWVGSAMLGVDREHLNEHSFSQYVCESDSEKFNNSIEQCFSRGEKITVEIELLIKGGESINTQMLMVPVEGIDGQTLCRTAITDITELKRTEDKFLLFRNLVDKSYDAIFVSDSETSRILDVNEKACTSLGYTREELLNMRVLDVETIFPDENAWENHVREVEKEGGMMIIEGFNKRKDGSIFPVEVNLSLISFGSKRYFIAVVRDVTLRKIAETHNAKRLKLAHLGAEIGVALNHGSSLQKMLQNCTEAIVYYLEAAFARIWTFNKGEDILELQASAGMYTHIDGEHSRIPVNSKYKLGFIAISREPHLTNNVIGDPQIMNQEWAKMEGMVAFAGYPLIVDNSLVGVMAMFSRKPFEDFALKALGSVANNIALGIKRKQADEELKKVFIELSDSLQHINTLSGILPVCQSCKKIRDENGEWNELEIYVKEKMESDLSSVLCPECEKNSQAD